MSVTDAEVKALEEKAEGIRETIISMLVAAGSGHTAGPLGMPLPDCCRPYAFQFVSVIASEMPQAPCW